MREGMTAMYRSALFPRDSVLPFPCLNVSCLRDTSKHEKCRPAANFHARVPGAGRRRRGEKRGRSERGLTDGSWTMGRCRKVSRSSVLISPCTPTSSCWRTTSVASWRPQHCVSSQRSPAECGGLPRRHEARFTPEEAGRGTYVHG